MTLLPDTPGNAPGPAAGHPAKSLPGGRFFTFEGPEGSGKTTQLTRLADTLRAHGYTVLTTREPGGTPLAERIRDLLLTCRDETVAPEAELLLFSAARIQHMNRVILPALNRGDIVLCDRFIDSTAAYQGYARGLSLDLIRTASAIATAGRLPDRTFLLDVPRALSIRRLARRYAGAPLPDDRFEKEAEAFHEKVREGFLDLARKNPDRIVLIPADRSPEAVHDAILTELQHVIGRL